MMFAILILFYPRLELWKSLRWIRRSQIKRWTQSKTAESHWINFRITSMHPPHRTRTLPICCSNSTTATYCSPRMAPIRMATISLSICTKTIWVWPTRTTTKAAEKVLCQISAERKTVVVKLLRRCSTRTNREDRSIFKILLFVFQILLVSFSSSFVYHTFAFLPYSKFNIKSFFSVKWMMTLFLKQWWWLNYYPVDLYVDDFR